MKVIIAVDAIHYPLTGIGRYARAICRGLERSPAISSLRYIAHGRWLSDLPTPAAARPVGWPRRVLAGSRLATSLYGGLMPMVMRQRLRAEHEAVYHSPNFVLPATRGPAVATFHDLSIFDYPEFHPESRVAFMRRMIPQALSRASLLIAVSEFTRRRMIERFNWPPERVVTVPLGVDPQQFAPADPAEADAMLAGFGLGTRRYTLCVSTIEPRKNLGALILAYRRLPRSMREDCPLVLVGDRGWRSESTHAAIQAGVAEGWLHYHGYLSDPQLRILMAHPALFIFPSLYEGFGLPVLEAMASGAPVLTSDLEPIREFAADSVGYFDPTDAEALSSALLQALDDSSWRAGVAEAGYRQSSAHRWTRTVEQTIEAYRQARRWHAPG